MANHAKYINSETQLFDTKYTTDRNCPVCNSSNKRDLFTKSGGVYVACNSCDMVFLSPVFKDEYLEEYYRTNHDVQSEIVEQDNEFYRNLYEKGLTLATKHLPAKGKVLDVGCSAGAFLDIAMRNDWKTYGLELNAKEAIHSRKKGHTVFENTIHKANLSETFDLVTLWDVFEHISDGISFLNSTKKLLRDGGLVFIQSPTKDSLAAKMLQEKCNMFDGLEHVNLYGLDSMKKLAEVTGFELIAYETVISEIGVMNNHLNYEDPYLGNVKEKKGLLGVIDENWLHANHLGYKFQLCLRLVSK